jgi:hypothetical protein
MPYFDFSIEEHIDVDEFLSECSSKEIEELIEALIEDGHIHKSSVHRESESTNVSVGESFFQDALDKLYNKWNVLSNEEEQLILNIAKRF